MPFLRPAIAVLLLAVGIATVAQPRAHAKDDDPAKRADALHARYEAGVKHTDFGSFSRRMDAVRALGRLDTPRARKHLLAIASGAKGIDDRIVAFMTLGPRMSVDEAKTLARIVDRRRDPLLAQSLAQAYILAERDDVHAWLATDALTLKQPLVLQAVLDAQTIHADARARPGLLAVFERVKDRPRDATLAYGAVRAIGAIADREDRTFLLRVPGHEDARVRLAGAETIARQKPVDINVRGAIVTYLHDESPVVREAALEAVGQAGIVELTDNVADALEDEHLRTRAVAHAALVEMHRRDLGWDPTDWKRWWKTRKDLPGDRKMEPTSSVARYYGMQVRSDRVLFIIDLSGSMAFPWGAEVDKTRIGVAKQQLTQAIESLGKHTLFNVIVFSDDVKAWRKTGETLASTSAKADALAWIDKTFEKPTGGTYMHAALEEAFARNPQVDTIYLLTDGLATDGEPIVPEAILASVHRWNRFRRVVIHTIALTLEDLQPDALRKESLAGIKQFMRRLASLTGGEYRVVKTPPTKPK